MVLDFLSNVPEVQGEPRPWTPRGLRVQRHRGWARGWGGKGRTLELKVHLDCSSPPGVHMAHTRVRGPTWGTWGPMGRGSPPGVGACAGVGWEEAVRRLWASRPALAFPHVRFAPGRVSLPSPPFSGCVCSRAVPSRARANLSALGPQTWTDRGLGSRSPADRLVSPLPAPGPLPTPCPEP